MSIDFRTLPQNVPILCIPRVYPNISETRIRRIFEDLNMGTLERIDMVSKQSDRGERFNRVFVHFRRWNDSENACVARERLLNGKEIKIIYDDPWFWKISAYREVERRPNNSNNNHRQNAPPMRIAPKLQFDSDEERPRPRPDTRQSEERRSEERPNNSNRSEDRRPRRNDVRRSDTRRPKQRRDESPARPKSPVRPKSPTCPPPQQKKPLKIEQEEGEIAEK